MEINNVLRVTPEEKMAIKKYYGKSDNEISEDIRIIREWLKKQQHLPQDTDDKQLEKILRMNKFSLEKTKKKIDMYYTVRNLVPEFFEDRDLFSFKMQAYMDNITFVPLPKLTEDFSRVHIFRYNTNDVNKFDFDIHVKYAFATGDLRYFQDECLSDIYIIDFENATLGHILKTNIMSVKKGATVIEKAYSDRIKGIHYVNTPAYAQTLVSLAQSILKQKIAERVHVHQNFESLHKFIPKSNLPVEYGGTEKPLSELNDNWRKFLENNNEWIKKLGLTKSNEKLRQEQLIDSDIFGCIHGSFRQLNLD